MKTEVMYSCIHKKICEKFHEGNIIKQKRLISFFRVVFHIPKSLCPIVIRELEERSMLKCKNHSVEIKPLKDNPEKNVGKLYNKYFLE